jgi:hypothetical protein
MPKKQAFKQNTESHVNTIKPACLGFNLGLSHRGIADRNTAVKETYEVFMALLAV